MNKYEAMMMIRPDLSEELMKALFNQINEAVTKFEGKTLQANIWGERRKLYFPIRKYREGLYYLVNFTAPAQAIKDIRQAYKLNENILRVLITKGE